MLHFKCEGKVYLLTALNIEDLISNGTLLGWVVFLLGGGIAYGRLSTKIDSLDDRLRELRTEFHSRTFTRPCPKDIE